MTSTLTVMALVVRLRSSEKTVYGDAIYREKIFEQNHTFGFKQFINSRHEYNETFKEGDLVLFGGKFTLEGEKLMVNFNFSIILILNYVLKKL
jgi:hypothetical protein